MKKLLLLLFPLLAVGTAFFVSAQEAKLESLFNGKDLTGWKGNTELWSVKDGVIYGETTKEKPAKGNTFLIWQGGEVGDFEFVCQVKFSGNNSGVQYRSKVVDDENFVVAGYQADLHPKPEYFGMLYAEKLGKRGVVAQRGQRVKVGEDGNPKVVEKFPLGARLTDDAWNELRIVAVGDRAIHLVNGAVTVDITDNHPELASRSGVIALQLHAGPPMKVEFKDLKLRKLKGDEAKAVLKKAAASKPKADAAAAGKKNAAGKGKGSAKRADFAWVSNDPKPTWIWRADKTDNEWIFLRKKFALDADVKAARLYATCDNELELWINGKKAGRAPDWGNPILIADAKSLLKTGENFIAAKARNRGGIAATVLKLEVDTAGGKKIHLLSSPDWKMSLAEAEGWKTDGFDDSGWEHPLMSLGKFGVQPWGIAGIQGPGGGGGAPAVKLPLEPEHITAIGDFEVELLYTVPKAEQGSWVALTKDPKGRLIASDQGGAGFYRIKVSESAQGPRAEVEKIPAEVSGAWGMHWFNDSLYANINGKTLVRVYDSNGDDQLDAVEQLPGANGGGEHGNHAVIPTEDGKKLYIDAGNHTNLPELASSRVPTWDEDLLLPRQWDARGHARGRLAPGGWVAAFDPESKDYDLYCIGFRNQYDIALNRAGDMFTYDADMEWDLGTPWYRPTRICHVVSGGDYGWRSGSGKWPGYYEDSLPPVVDIGPGSPTGVVSGIGSNFQAKYRDAIYALDWTFGTIYAIHLEAKGAGYTGRSEPFVYGSPLPVTDAIIGDDGALYFTIGGRGAQSALYRAIWTGPNASETPREDSPEIIAARKLRRELEEFHGSENPGALEKSWPLLSSEDRFLRHAARVAVESQPADQWADRVLSESDPQARITGAVALARVGNPRKHRAKLLNALLELKPDSLTDPQLLGLLRAYALNFIRLGRPTGAERKAVIDALNPLLPSDDADVNTELIRVLVYLDAPAVIGKAVDLITNRGETEVPDWHELASRNPRYGGTVATMLANHPPTREIGYAFMLRNLKQGWTLKQRRAYFEFLNEAARYPGGASFAGFLTNLRDEALGNCTNTQRAALADVTGENFNPVPDFEIVMPKGPPQAWTIESARPHANRGSFKQASFENGRGLFHGIGCAACHRFGGFGGDIGPDLTSLRNKFDEAYVLEALINPSKDISDQYGSSEVTLKDGKRFSGLVVERDDDTLDIYPPDAKAEPAKVNSKDVEKIEAVPISQMPPGLINLLNGAELRDLMAYLMSGGNPKDKIYAK